MSEATRLDEPAGYIATAVNKVPEVTVAFWVLKILTTGMGEAASDFSVKTFGPVAVVVAGLMFAGALVTQLRTRRYRPLLYWWTIAMVGVFGTMAADVPHFLGIPLAVTSGSYLLVLVLVFLWWRAREGTLSFGAINTRSRELFYWAAVVATFALGTALGDLVAQVGRMGFLVAGLVFTAVILVPVLARRLGRLNPVLTFWSAYIVTRPLGASFADWMAVPARHGGLGLGAGPVTGLWVLAIVAVPAGLAVRRRTAARPARG
jgi:uncharacterized membrane-anchored protein